MSHRSGDVPSSVGAAAEAVVAARGRPGRLKRVFDRSPVPTVMVDRERRYVDANGPARLAFRLSLTELRSCRVDDLTPPHFRPSMESAWRRLVDFGSVAGRYEVMGPDGGRLDIVYYALANALPGLHVGAFAPAGWSDGELSLNGDEAPAPRLALTPRELDVLQLAAQGRTGPRIADELVLSQSTVKTHFVHIYWKLGVGDRAAAVAKAMRLGLID
jgi:DNA-binding CsgD family transcriptional regulator